MDSISAISQDIDRVTVKWLKSQDTTAKLHAIGLSPAMVRAIQKDYAKRLRHLTDFANAPLPVIQNEVHLIAKSRGARLFAALRAYENVKGVDAGTLLDVVANLSPDHLTHEKVKIRPEKSKTKAGDSRLIALTGIKRRAIQIILRDIALAFHGDSDIDGAVKGAGGEKGTIEKIKNAIQSDKMVYWTSLDVKSFFPSLRPGHFGDTIFPKKWIAKAVFLPEVAELVFIDKEKGISQKVDLSPLADGDVETLLSSYGSSFSKLKKVRQGMIAGDAIAPLLARWFLGRELQQMLKELGVVWFSYCDDLAIGSRTEGELSKAIEALKHRLQSHPAGPLETYGGEINHIGKGFEFLNYFIRRHLGVVRVTPGIERFARLRERLWLRLVIADQAGQNSSSALGVVTDTYFANWYASQAAWTKVPNSFAYAKAEADRVLNFFMFRLYEDGAEYLAPFINFEEAINAALQWETLVYSP